MSVSTLLLKRLPPNAKQRDPRQRSLAEWESLGAQAESFCKHDMWVALMSEIDDYEASVVRELVRKGGSDDNEKRAMLFALQIIRNFPQRLIEAGDKARRARLEAEQKSNFARMEAAGQAYETLGPETLGNPNF